MANIKTFYVLQHFYIAFFMPNNIVV